METAIRIALTANAAFSKLDADRATLYYDFVEAALSEAARKAFSMIEGYQFQGPTLRKVVEDARLESEVEAVLAVLEARGFSVTEPQRGRIRECKDGDVIKGWIRRAVSVNDVEELFEKS